MIELSLDYDKEEELNKEDFLKKDANLVFDSSSKTQMYFMMESLIDELNLSEAYAIKKLEYMLKYDLPFFATNRRLVRDWVINNFIF